MMTLNQWKNTRRVDHVALGPFNPRVQAMAPGVPHLDAFDADVGNYIFANNNFDRVTLLGRIMVRARGNYLNVPAVPQQYQAAVLALYNVTQADLNLICQPMYQMQRTLGPDGIGRRPRPGSPEHSPQYFLSRASRRCTCRRSDRRDY